MNLNILTYSIYLPIMSFITIYVGKVFHSNGGVYINTLFPNEIEFSHRINNLLLIGYYMLNLGYVAVVISLWEPVQTWGSMISTLANKSGFILLVLATMHYINMLVIFLIARTKIKINNNSNS